MLIPLAEDNERHRLRISIITESAVLHIFTKTDYRKIIRSGKLPHLHPRILLAGGLIEHVHIAVTRLEATPFSDTDTHHLQKTVIHRKRVKLNMLVLTSTSPPHIEIARAQDKLRERHTFHTRYARQFSDNGIRLCPSLRTHGTYDNGILVIPIVSSADIAALQIHDANRDDKHKRHEKLDANQRAAQLLPFGRQTERAFQYQSRRKRCHIIGRIKTGEHSHQDTDTEG